MISEKRDEPRSRLGRGARSILTLSGVVIVFWGLRESAYVLVPFVTAVFITVVSMPVVRWLTARRVPRWAAVVLALLLDVCVLVGFGSLIASSFSDFQERAPYYSERLGVIAMEAVAWLELHGARMESVRIEHLMAQLPIANVLKDITDRTTSWITSAAIAGLLVLFMLFESSPWRTKLAYILRRPALDLPRFANAAREVQTYLVVKSALSVVTGALCGGWVAICGVDFPLLWALLAFLLNYIPTVGMFIATIPPVIVGLIQFGPGGALLVLAGYLVINFTLGNLVEPRVMGRALGLSPLVVFLSMVFWGWLWGPIGALLSVPLTMVIKIALANTEEFRWVAILLGSSEWFAQKRREWENPFQAERRRSQVPPAPSTNVAVASEEANPPLDAEDAFEGSGPRAIGDEPQEPVPETVKTA